MGMDWDVGLFCEGRRECEGRFIHSGFEVKVSGFEVKLVREVEGVYDLMLTIVLLVSILLSYLPLLQGTTNPHQRGALVCHPLI